MQKKGLEERLIEFAVRVIRVAGALPKSRFLDFARNATFNAIVFPKNLSFGQHALVL